MLPKPAPNYPKTGELRGKTIDLARALATLSPEDLAEVVVDVPGVGRIRPWRFAAPSSDEVELRDGALVID